MNKLINRTTIEVLVLIIIVVLSFLYLKLNPVISQRICDFGSDEREERLVLKNKELNIYGDEEIIFTTSFEQEVTEFEVGDINNDGKDELVIGFWRFGDYGKNLKALKPRRDPKKSYHLFVYQYSHEVDKFYLIWGSSTLPHPIYDFSIEFENGQNVLKVKEGSYDDYDKNGKIEPINDSTWIWNEWWFELLPLTISH